MAISITTKPACGGVQRGFSLLETLLVVVLIAAVGTLAALVLSAGLDGMRLRQAGKEMTGALRHARARAIASGQSQRFEIDPGGRIWRAAGRQGAWPSALDVRFTGARELQPDAGVGAIVFFADGASSGGRIELIRDSVLIQIDVAWLTGQVRTGTGNTQ